MAPSTLESFIRAAEGAQSLVATALARCDGSRMADAWEAVESAANVALMLYGKTRLRLQSLQSLSQACSRCELPPSSYPSPLATFAQPVF